VDKSIVLRECLNAATGFDLAIKLGKLFHAETQQLKKSFASMLVGHYVFRILNSWETEWSHGAQGVR